MLERCLFVSVLLVTLRKILPLKDEVLVEKPDLTESHNKSWKETDTVKHEKPIVTA